MKINTLGLYLGILLSVFAVNPTVLGQSKSKPFKLSKKEKKEGFKVLFDGTSMDQWQGNTEEYILEDGTITMHPGKRKGTPNLYSKGTYSDFVLRFEFLLSPSGNNGLGIRHDLSDAPSGYNGMELQILDNEHPDYKNLEPGQYHGSVYKILPAKRGFLKPAGEWNYQEVIAKGSHIQVILNGEKILDGDLVEATSKMKPGSFQKAVLNTSGHLAFLGHATLVRFRNIRIKELK